MKKLLILFLLSATLTACASIKEKTDTLVDDTKKSYGKAVETVNDIENAIDKVKEAKEAIDEVTE